MLRQQGPKTFSTWETSIYSGILKNLIFNQNRNNNVVIRSITRRILNYLQKEDPWVFEELLAIIYPSQPRSLSATIEIINDVCIVSRVTILRRGLQRASYHLQLVENLHPEDNELCLKFCNFIIYSLNNNEYFLQHTLWTNKTHLNWRRV